MVENRGTARRSNWKGNNMSEELKDALECWRNSGGFHASDPSECFEKVYTIAAAYVAEHPPPEDASMPKEQG